MFKKIVILVLTLVLLIKTQEAFQFGAASPGSKSAAYLTFKITQKINCLPLIKALSRVTLLNSRTSVLGFGNSLKEKCNDAELIELPPMRDYPDLKVFPHTPAELFVHIKTPERDQTFDVAYQFMNVVTPEKLFGLLESREIIGFAYKVGTDGLGRDLSGFVDGTVNAASLRARMRLALTPTNSSFILTQKWIHKLQSWKHVPVSEQEKIIGRTKPESRQLNPLPEGSHVERTNSRNLMVRQSMPYGGFKENGLFFIAYASDLHVFHHQLRRMGGAYGGVMDKIIGTVSDAVDGMYWYAPNMETIRKYAQ